jgi:hypothetical protein
VALTWGDRERASAGLKTLMDGAYVLMRNVSQPYRDVMAMPVADFMYYIDSLVEEINKKDVDADDSGETGHSFDPQLISDLVTGKIQPGG